MESKKRDLIDRGQINYTWWELPNGKFSDGVTLQSVIHSMPTVDAVEVVRCKDCVKAVRHEVFPWSRRCKVEDCRFSHKETHFCSYGERKDNE